MSEQKQYDNSDQIAIWKNEDGSLFVTGNINGGDFKFKAFTNNYKTPGSKAPDWKGKIKKQSVQTESNGDF